MKYPNVKISKFLSLVLRHEPERIGITLDPAGWTSVDELLEGLARERFAVSREELFDIVAADNKGRYALSEDRTRIRANQGHSVEVDLQYAPTTPPEVLYHGTPDRFLPAIFANGLQKGQRHHVHLSVSRETAANVGQRRGKPVILVVRAGEMHREGHTFFVSTNGVWLTDHVPARFLQEENEM